MLFLVDAEKVYCLDRSRRDHFCYQEAEDQKVHQSVAH